MGVIADPDANRVCTLSGVQQKLMQQRLVTLKDLEKALQISLQDASTAADDEEFWGAMIVIAKIVQVSCDLSVAMLEEETGPAGKGVSVLYDVSKIVVDAFNGDFDAKEGFKFSANVHMDVALAILKSKGAKWHKVAKVASDIKTLANLGDDLYDFYKKRGAGVMSFGGAAAKSGVFSVIRRIRSQIATIDISLSACKA